MITWLFLELSHQKGPVPVEVAPIVGPDGLTENPSPGFFSKARHVSDLTARLTGETERVLRVKEDRDACDDDSRKDSA
jgi:hypothetical protein